MRDDLVLTGDLSLAPAIARWRRRAGLSQADLAERIGTTQSVVSRWENGHDEPRIRTLVGILRACGLSGKLVVGDDVDRAQIRQQLALSPRQRLEAVANVAAARLAARRLDPEAERIGDPPGRLGAGAVATEPAGFPTARPKGTRADKDRHPVRES